MSKIIQDNEYGCLMIYFKIPFWWELLLDCIDDNDLYKKDKNDTGLETEPHCTLCFGFKLDKVDPSDIKKFCNKYIIIPISNIKEIPVAIISLFENEEYDVLKFSVLNKELDYLSEINKAIDKKFGKYIDNKHSYKPHITIAYLKKGKGEKYKSLLKNIVDSEMKIHSLVYSGSGQEKEWIIKI